MKKTLIGLLVLASFADMSVAQEAVTPIEQESPVMKPKKTKVGVSLRLNGTERGTVVSFRNGEIFAKASDLILLGLRPEAISGDEVSLLSLDPDVRYDKAKSTVSLTVPANMFFVQERSYLQADRPKPLDNEFGGWLNYDTRFQSVSGIAGFQSYLDGTFSTKWGVLQSQHVYNSLASSEKFKRIATSLRIDNEEEARTTILGDTYSLPGYWGTPVNFGGIRIARNFALNPPGFLTNPNYAIKGEATAPSVVEIWEGSQKTYSEKLPTGPFSISGYTPIKNGMAQVIVRDQFGNVTQQSVPLYSTPQHLADGLDAYSVELGMLKADGVYGETFLGASYRRGFNFHRIFDGIPVFEWVADAIPIATFEGRIEGLRGDMRFGMGIAVSCELGNITVSGATGQAKTSSNMGLSHAAVPIGGSVAVQNSPQSVADPSEKAPSIWQANWDRSFELGNVRANAFALFTKPSNWTPIGSSALARSSTVLGLSVVPAETMSASIVVTNSGESSEKRTSQTLSISKIISRDLSANLGLTRSDAGSVAMLSVSWNLGQAGYMSSMLSANSQSANYSGYSTDKLSSWSVGVGRDAQVSRFDGNFSSDFSRAHTFAAVSQAGNQTGYRAGISGSLLYVDGGLWLGRPINDSVVLVKSDLPDLGIKTNNLPAGRTNGQGEMVVSNLQAGRINKIEVNEREIPLGYQLNAGSTTSLVQHFGGISKVTISADKPGWMGVFTVDGVPIRAGTRVFINERQFFSSSKSVHAKNMPFGKTKVRIGDCEQEILVPDNSPKTIPKFSFDLQCKESS